MDSVFNRVLKLALRTGDKIIVIDPSQSKPYVMMDFEYYERLISKSDEYLNSGIAKQENQAENILRKKENTTQKENIITENQNIKLKNSLSYLVGEDKLSKPSLSKSEELETEEYFYFEPSESLEN